MKFEFKKYLNHIYFAFIFIFSGYLMINSYADKDPFRFFDKKSNRVQVYIGSFSDMQAMTSFLADFTEWGNQKYLNDYPPPYVKVTREDRTMVVTWGPFEEEVAQGALKEVLERWNILAEVRDE